MFIIVNIRQTYKEHEKQVWAKIQYVFYYTFSKLCYFPYLLKLVHDKLQKIISSSFDTQCSLLSKQSWLVFDAVSSFHISVRRKVNTDLVLS